MNVFDLWARLGLNKDEYDKGLSSAQKGADDFAQSAQATAAKTAKDVDKAFKDTQKSSKETSTQTKKDSGDTSKGVGEDSEKARKSISDALKKIREDVKAAAKEVDEESEGSSEKLGNLASKIGEGFTNAAKIAAKGITAVAGATATLAGLSVKSYASYEQLAGGVDTLFKESANIVKQYAQEAYSTAQMSANDYMENVTGFSAVLLQSLDGDTKKAAEVANRAVQDMSDNANKMGTSIDSITMTYQSLSRGNYAMLDNLKLGYGGTKKELERLIKDSSEMTDVQKELGVTVDGSSMSFDNVINAISVMQEHLGIAGTSANEAATTIEGSANAMKAAWQNVLTGFADENQDLGNLLKIAIESAATYADNVVPRIAQALTGIGQAFDVVIPEIASRLPETLGKLAPSMVTAIYSLITNVGSAVATYAPELFNQLFNALPSAMATGTDLLTQGVTIATSIMESIAQGLPQGIPLVLGQVMPLLVSLSESLRENAGTLIDGALDLVLALAQGIANSLPVLIETIPTIVTNIAGIINDNAPKLLETAGKLILTLGQGIISSIPVLIQNLPQIFEAIWSVFMAMDWIGIGKGAIKMLAKGVKVAGKLATNAFTNLRTNAVKALASLPSRLLSLGKSAVSKLAGAVRGGISSAGSAAKGILTAIINAIRNLPTRLFNIARNAVTRFKNKFLNNDWGELGRNIVNGIIDGITGIAGKLVEKAHSLVSSFFGAANEEADAHSPSRRAYKDAQYWVQGYLNGADALLHDVEKSGSGVASTWFDAVNRSASPELAFTTSAKFGVSAKSNKQDDTSMLIALLDRYLPEIARGMQLDGRSVSRALVGYMDDDLGSRTRQRARAN